MESGGLLEQLGVNWKLFLSQAFNFFILLVILRLFAYKPLLAVIKKRNEKIKEGLQKAQEADVRLKEVDTIAKAHLKKADQESIEIIKHTEQKAKELEQTLSAKAEAHHKALMTQMEVAKKRQEEEARQNVLQGASELVKKILVKTVQMDPGAIDQALIQKAILHLDKE
jgi:F-type H+-transporting ATPase subunit b